MRKVSSSFRQKYHTLLTLHSWQLFHSPLFPLSVRFNLPPLNLIHLHAPLKISKYPYSVSNTLKYPHFLFVKIQNLLPSRAKWALIAFEIEFPPQTPSISPTNPSKHSAVGNKKIDLCRSRRLLLSQTAGFRRFSKTHHGRTDGRTDLTCHSRLGRKGCI